MTWNARNHFLGLGAFVRDQVGKVIAAAVKTSKFHGDIAFAEAEAMEWGMQIAEHACLRLLVVELDSTEVINFVNN